MDGKMLRDDQWKHIEPLCSGKASKREVTGRDNRRFADAVLWIARTGSPWRDLPQHFGAWHTAYMRFSRWSKNGVWARMAEHSSVTPIWSSCLSTRPSCELPNTRPAPPKNGRSSHRTQPEEPEHQDSCDGRSL